MQSNIAFKIQHKHGNEISYLFGSVLLLPFFYVGKLKFDRYYITECRSELEQTGKTEMEMSEQARENL